MVHMILKRSSSIKRCVANLVPTWLFSRNLICQSDDEHGGSRTGAKQGTSTYRPTPSFDDVCLPGMRSEGYYSGSSGFAAWGDEIPDSQRSSFSADIKLATRAQRYSIYANYSDPTGAKFMTKQDYIERCKYLDRHCPYLRDNMYIW